jgi:hypothetical protein
MAQENRKIVVDRKALEIVRLIISFSQENWNENLRKEAKRILDEILGDSQLSTNVYTCRQCIQLVRQCIQVVRQ